MPTISQSPWSALCSSSDLLLLDLLAQSRVLLLQALDARLQLGRQLGGQLGGEALHVLLLLLPAALHVLLLKLPGAFKLGRV